MSYSDHADKGQAQLMNLLEEKLDAKSWKEADELTKILMLKISCRKDGNYLHIDIDNFPEKEIEEIDRLWRNNSGSHFGFSVQKSRYNHYTNQQDYQQFITNVGWYKGSSWLKYDSLFSWTEDSLEKGRLPYCGPSFWEGVYVSSGHSSSSNHNHFHQPHYHAHRHGASDGAAGLAALGATLVAAAPVILGAAAVAGAGYLVYREATKEERKRQEKLAKEESDRKEKQRQLEEHNKIQENISKLFALI